MPSSANGSVMVGSIRQFAVHRTDHRTDRDAVLRAEFEVALVVRGHGHDRAGAVAHQHEVADPDRHLLAAERIDRRSGR